MQTKKQIDFNLEDFREEGNRNFQVQFREITPKENYLFIIAYMWRDGDKNQIFHSQINNSIIDCRSFPFCEKQSVYMETYKHIPITGKIYNVDNDYYDGDCIVLYIKSDKASLKRFLKYHSK